MGFKKTSDLIAVSFGVTSSAADTYTEEEIALQLDVLNNEIFVVVACDLNPNVPTLVAGSLTATTMSVSSTSATGIQDLADSNCLATSQLVIRSSAGEAVAFTRASEESVPTQLDYVGINRHKQLLRWNRWREQHSSTVGNRTVVGLSGEG